MNRPGGPGGFTLIEMLVVLGILALITNLGFPAVERIVDQQRFAAASRALYLSIVQARADAIRSGRTVEVSTLAVSASGDAHAVVATELPPAGLRFYADGTSNGGTAQVKATRQTVNIVVAADTGLVTVRP